MQFCLFVCDPLRLDRHIGNHFLIGEVPPSLARYKALKKVLLVPDEFTSTDRTLTPTLKLRRSAIEERYRPLIDALYDETRSSASA